MMGMDDERESRESMLSAHIDGDDYLKDLVNFTQIKFEINLF